MRFLARLCKDTRGASAVEFAVAAPVFLTFLIGITQIGVLAQANNSLNYGIDEAARLAVIYPQPTTATVEAKLRAATNDIDQRRLTFAITYGTVGTVKYADMVANYTVSLNFIFFSTSDFVLTQRRRAYQS